MVHVFFRFYSRFLPLLSFPSPSFFFLFNSFLCHLFYASFACATPFTFVCQSRAHPSGSVQLVSAKWFVCSFVYRVYIVCGFGEEDSLKNVHIFFFFFLIKKHSVKPFVCCLPVFFFRKPADNSVSLADSPPPPKQNQANFLPVVVALMFTIRGSETAWTLMCHWCVKKKKKK